MGVRPLCTTEQLDPLAGEWNALTAGVPMLGHTWLAGWLRVYGDHAGEPLVLSVYRDQELIGLAPWRIENSLRSGRAIRWLGDGEVCTDHLTVLCREGDREEVAQQLADWLLQNREDWDLLSLDHCDSGDQALDALFTALDERGCHTQASEDDACWTIDLPSDWEEFLARQSKSHRKQLRRAESRVLESAACQWTPVRTLEDWDRAWGIFVDLHQRRRQSLGEPGCFASERFTEFHRTLSRNLLESDQLRMSWIELDGQPVAAEYHFASADAVYAYQGGVDPERLDDEPGRLSNIATLKDAIAAGCSTFDFLRGDEPYKAHWRAVAQTTLSRLAVAPRSSARLRAQAGWAAGSAKNLLKNSLRTLGGNR